MPGRSRRCARSMTMSRSRRIFYDRLLEMNMKLTIPLICLALLAAATGRLQAQEEGDLRKGRVLAREVCAACHAIEKGRPSPNADAPTFEAIASTRWNVGPRARRRATEGASHDAQFRDRGRRTDQHHRLYPEPEKPRLSAGMPANMEKGAAFTAPLVSHVLDCVSNPSRPFRRPAWRGRAFPSSASRRPWPRS